MKAERKAEALEAPRQAVTLKELAKAHLVEKKAIRNAKSARDLAIVLKPLTEGELASKRVVEFRPKDALVLLYSIAGSAPSAARALRQEIAQATRSAALREVIPPDTPNVWGLCRADSVLRARLAPSKRSKVLTDAELAAWLAWLRQTSGLVDWSAHDLRRSCRTGFARLGCPREVAEAALGHSKVGIVGVYDLYRFEREVG